MQYCTVEEVADRIGISAEVPSYNDGEREAELVDNSTTLQDGSIVYTSNTRLIENTLVLSYGADVNTLTALSITDDFTLDLEKGKIIFTAAGVAKILTDNVYAEYKYIVSDGKTNDYLLSNIIDSQTELIDKLTNKTFQPPVLINGELQKGLGAYDTHYRSEKLPMFIQKTNLSSNIDATTTTLPVSSTSNLEAGDFLSIEDEVVRIVSITDSENMEVIRGDKDTTGATHVSGSLLINLVVEVSLTPSGSTPVFTFAKYQSDYTVDEETNYITINNTNYTGDNIYTNISPVKNAEDRFKLTYKMGAESVPEDINEVCILMSAKSLYNNQVLSAVARGTDGFTSDGMASINTDIKTIINRNKALLAQLN